DPSLTANASTVLKAMPAESVTKIEVINEPGAKYDAEGSAGIINIITVRKQKQAGYSGSLTAGISNRQLMGSAYFLAKHRNVTASLQAVHARSAFKSMHSTQHIETENFASSTDRLMTSHMEQYVKFNYTGVDGNLSWEPNSSNLFTLGVNFSSVDGKIDHLMESIDMKDAAGATRWSYNRDIKGSMKNIDASVNASFQHSFADNPAHNLILSYRFNYGRSPFELFMTYCDIVDYPTPYLFERSLNTAYNREHTAQIDYSNPFDGEHHKLETGLKAIWRPNLSIGSKWDGADATSAVWDPELYTSLRQNVDIYAAYASYTGSFNAFSVKGGLRYEHTRMGIDYHTGEIPDFTTHLNDLVPNAAVSYNFNMAKSLRLAYQMRISRPSINQVNPFRQSLGSQMVQYGNPDLRSERSNKVSLTYSSFGRIVGGSIGVECSMRNNTISEFIFMEDNVRNVTYANLGHRTRTSLNGFLTWSVIFGMRLVLNGSLDYTDLSAPSASLHNSGWGGNWNINWNYSLPHDWETSAYGGQSFRNINLQGYSDGWYYYGLAITKSLLADKSLRLSLNASSFLQRSQPFTTVTWTDA
ncbi:MAG: TonB-dependent receptor, partial [Muribaculaceae bacterium]|nr:TonB-dependent receptor [Muribaculaceae bacterium]